MPNAVITATGSYIPTLKVPNEYFLGHEFYGPDGTKLEKPTHDIISQFQGITCINERRYITDGLNTSDIAYHAAKQALDGVDMESLDCIIVAQNLGDASEDTRRSDMVPTIAARVKHKL